jgi:hypothetical protein
MLANERLSEFFTYGELIRSDSADRRGIDNTPDAAILMQLRRTARKMDRVRQLLNMPVFVNSGFRCVPLNVAVGGVANSQHCEGKAIDFVSPQFGSVPDIFDRIRRSDIVYDQLIREFHNSPGGGWVHISFVDTDPRRSAFDLP